MLAAIRDRIGPEHTVGEVLDAAEALGWGEPMNELSLADLAAALLAPIGDAATAETERQPEVAAPHEDEAEADDERATDDDEADDEADDEEDELEAPVARGRGSKKAGKKKTTAKAGKKKAASKAKAAAPAKTARGKKAPAGKAPAGKATQKAARGSAAKASASSTTARGKKTGRGRKPAKVDFDEPMSLDEAAAVLVPLVKSLGEATMQDLEEQTAGGRRKLRFHIGQLVREGYLVRHGMGRGTFYTVG